MGDSGDRAGAGIAFPEETEGKLKPAFANKTREARAVILEKALDVARRDALASRDGIEAEAVIGSRSRMSF